MAVVDQKERSPPSCSLLRNRHEDGAEEGRLDGAPRETARSPNSTSPCLSRPFPALALFPRLVLENFTSLWFGSVASSLAAAEPPCARRSSLTAGRPAGKPTCQTR